MKSSVLAALLAATVLGVATTDMTEGTYSNVGLEVRNVGYQGDGFYLAVFDEAGVANVEFTPLAELNLAPDDDAAKIDLATSSLVERSVLNKRGTVCGGIGRVQDMDSANIQLARNGDGRFYGQHAWGWVSTKSEITVRKPSVFSNRLSPVLQTFAGEVTSYFCNYQAQTLTYSKIIEFHTKVSNGCGGSQRFGYHRCTNACGVNDLAVGRTFRGDHFCDCCFTGL